MVLAHRRNNELVEDLAKVLACCLLRRRRVGGRVVGAACSARSVGGKADGGACLLDQQRVGGKADGGACSLARVGSAYGLTAVLACWLDV